MEIFQYDFMLNAFLAGLLASIAAGIVGTFVVVKRIVFIGGGISHAAYGGIGLGYLVGVDPIWGALGFSLAASLLVARFRTMQMQREETLIGIIWAGGMALGILFISLSAGYAPNLMSYLFGNILTVPFEELIFMAAADLVILSLLFLFYPRFHAVTFDEEFAATLGLRVNLYNMLLYVMIGLTTVMLIRLVGIILVIALLSLPAAVAVKWARSLKGMMGLSALLGFLFCTGGLLFSYYLGITSGASIVLLSAVAYVVSLLLPARKEIRA